MPELYVAVDVEADGPIPGPYSHAVPGHGRGGVVGADVLHRTSTDLRRLRPRGARGLGTRPGPAGARGAHGTGPRCARRPRGSTVCAGTAVRCSSPRPPCTTACSCTGTSCATSGTAPR